MSSKSEVTDAPCRRHGRWPSCHSHRTPTEITALDTFKGEPSGTAPSVTDIVIGEWSENPF
jgi:hypothetical protein